MNTGQATLQAAFDTAAAHMLRQGAKAIDSHGYHRYRDFHGRMCGVGVLLTKAGCIDGDQQDIVAYELPAEAFREQFRGLPAAFLEHLQHAHDFYYADEWPSALRELAEEFGLNPEILP